MNIQNKRILVTGGAGFLGSHLCKSLLKNNNEVICVDNLFTGSLNNIKELLQNKKFQFINHDIIEPLSIDVDQIYNLACPASPIHYQLDPIKTTKTSVIGILNMLGLAKRTGATLLHTSTSEVYGDPEVHPQPESYRGSVNPHGIRACYDEGKRVAESLCFDYHRQHHVKIKIIRIFNTYGPGMNVDDGRVVSNFIIQALKNEDITIYGDGTQTRSFCFVDDLIKGMIQLMESREGFTGPVNMGNPNEFTIKQLAELVLSLTGSKSNLIYKPLPQDDPLQRKPVIDLAHNELNWSPEVQLKDGLIKTIDYFRKVL